MNILFLVPYAPNLIRVRPYQLIRSLARRGHQLTVVTLWSDESEKADLHTLQGNGVEVIAHHLPRWRSFGNCMLALPSRKPLQAAYCWHPDLAQTAQRLVTHKNGRPAFDVIHVEHLRGAVYGLHIKSIASQPVVWDSVDSISHLFRQAAERSRRRANRWLTRFELARTERYEGWLAGQFEHTLVTSTIDRQALLELRPAHLPPKPVTVLPNGVDLDYFTPGLDRTRQADTLVLSGKMSYHANVTMALILVEQVMPLVWEQRPQVKVWIVGKDPAREVSALGADERITVTGTVSEVRTYLQSAAVAVAPIAYGAGIQNKVLEAMACATPVVSTPQAVSALALTPGKDILTATTPRQFAQQVLALLEQPEHRRQIGLEGRRYVETHHNWDVIVAQLEEVYKQTAQQQALGSHLAHQ